MRHFFKDFLESFSYLIYTISVFIVLNKSKSIRKKVLFFYYLTVTLLLLVASFTKNPIVNNCIYNVFFFTTVCVFSYYFKSLLFINKTKRSLINFLFIINLILFISFDVVNHRLFEYNTHVYAITFLSIVVYALLYFEQVIRNVNELNLLHQFDFWLISGYLLYFLSSFFIILFYNNVEINQRAVLWSLQNIILFLSSVLTISGSIWIFYQKSLL